MYTATKIHPEQSRHNPETDQFTIVDRVARFIERFAFLKDKQLYRLIATWTVATYLAEHFDYIGYLFVYSPEAGCGKSIVLDILDQLVHRSSGVLIDPTKAILFRTAHNSTQIFDEVDTWANLHELKGILNQGFKNGGVVKRMDANDATKKLEAQTFSVYAPRVLAGIGLNILHPVTRQRTFAIRMVKRTKAERGEIFSIQNAILEAEIQALKKAIEAWADQNRSEIKQCYNQRRFPYLEKFEDRTIDISLSLAAVHEVAYRSSPRSAEPLIELLEGITLGRAEQEKPAVDQMLDHQILRALLRLVREQEPVIGNASELAAQCTERFEDSRIGHTLQKYGIEPKSARRSSGDPPRYRYVLRAAELEDIVSRFVPSNDGEEPVPETEKPTAALPSSSEVVNSV